LETTKSRFLEGKEEHVYSLRLKPEDKTEHWNCTQDISEAHYKTDLNIMQNIWLDRQNFMSDQILLDHRYSVVRGLEIERTAVARSNNLCSPTRKKRTNIGDNKTKPSPVISSLPLKRGSVGADLPPKKRAKTRPIGAMFNKAKSKGESQGAESKQINKKLIFGTTTKSKPSVGETSKTSQKKMEKHSKSSSELDQSLNDGKQSKDIASSSPKLKVESPQNPQLLKSNKTQPQVAEHKTESKKTAKKKTGLFNFFSASKKTNPFDADKKKKSMKSLVKRNVKKVNKKISTKKKAIKKNRYKASTKPKRRAPQKKTPPEDVEMFADEESEDDSNTWQQLQLEQEKEEEEELEMFQEVLRKRKKSKKSILRDSDSESEAASSQKISEVISKPVDLDSGSEDEKPVKISAKERRASRKAEEEKRKKELLASRKSNFWGAAKDKMRPKRKKTKIRSRNYVDKISGMLVTEEIEETDEEVKEVAT